VTVIGESSTDILPLLDTILSAKHSRHGVAVLGRYGSARVSRLLSSIKSRTETTLFISLNAIECGQNRLNISKLNSMFAKLHIRIVHVVFERAEFQSRHLGIWSHEIGVLLRRYIATLEALVKYDVTTRVVLHIDVTASQRHNMTLLCSDPVDVSHDLSDVIFSSAYSFANVYRNLYMLNHVYTILYVHDN